MTTSNRKDNPILNLTFSFSLDIINYCELLETNRKFVIANQLLKSGTSIGANIKEAQNAESKADFYHKIKIAMKEVEETEYWLELCQMAENYPDCIHLIEKLLEIRKVMSKIISTFKSNTKIN